MKKPLSVWLALASVCVLAVSARASLVYEKFATDPSVDGWQVFGTTNLFAWDPTNHVLDVTWDSTQPNSYYYHPLGVTLTTNDSFCVQFDLVVSNAAAFDYGMQLAVGLLHWSEATNSAFSRPNVTAQNAFEFDYFPAFNFGGYANGDEFTASIVDGAGNLFWNADYQTLTSNVMYHVVLFHDANSLGNRACIYTNGQVMSTFPLPTNYYPTNDDGAFGLDTLAVMSYADDGWGDDIYAQGTIANLSCQSPLPVQYVQALAAGQLRFASDTNWLYTLEETADFQTWTPAAAPSLGNGTNLVLQATNTPSTARFYRVEANLP